MYFRNNSEEVNPELNNEDINFQESDLDDNRHKHHKHEHEDEDECEEMEYMEYPMHDCPMMHQNPMMYQCPMMHHSPMTCEQPMMYENPMMYQQHMKSSSDTKCYHREDEENDEMLRQYQHHNRPNYYHQNYYHQRPRPYYPPYFNPYFLPYFFYGYPQHRTSDYMHYNQY
jgi:hypothetical protein